LFGLAGRSHCFSLRNNLRFGYQQHGQRQIAKTAAVDAGQWTRVADAVSPHVSGVFAHAGGAQAQRGGNFLQAGAGTVLMTQVVLIVAVAMAKPVQLPFEIEFSEIFNKFVFEIGCALEVFVVTRGITCGIP
jgi:hypothetical protein